jgi:anti-anti-sigma regulatory factor
VRGEEPPDPGEGWGAYHAVHRDREAGFQKHFKLVNPQPRVDRVLETVGFKRFLETYTDLETAVASF